MRERTLPLFSSPTPGLGDKEPHPGAWATRPEKTSAAPWRHRGGHSTDSSGPPAHSVTGHEGSSRQGLADRFPLLPEQLAENLFQSLTQFRSSRGLRCVLLGRRQAPIAASHSGASCQPLCKAGLHWANKHSLPPKHGPPGGSEASPAAGWGMDPAGAASHRASAPGEPQRRGSLRGHIPGGNRRIWVGAAAGGVWTRLQGLQTHMSWWTGVPGLCGPGQAFPRRGSVPSGWGAGSV